MKKFRVGRGLGSGRGKTSGRGTKGQRSRSGGKSGLKMKGLKRMLLGFPKVRGFQSMSSKPASVPLVKLEQFAEGATITLSALRKEGLVHRADQSAKIVGNGPLTKKITIKGIAVSAGAKAVIEKLGGSVTS